MQNLPIICGCSLQNVTKFGTNYILRYVKYVIFEILLAFFENFPCTYLLFYIIDHPDCTEKNHILKWRYWWYARSHSQSSSLYSISNPMIPRCSSAGCSWKKVKKRHEKVARINLEIFRFKEFLPVFSSAHFHFRFLCYLRWEFQAWPPLTIWLDELMYPFYYWLYMSILQICHHALQVTGK